MTNPEIAPLILTYAPPANRRRFYIAVYVAGLASTVLALLAVYLIQRYTDGDIMGIHMFLVPLGAIGVGIVAGLGYCFGSYISGRRLGGGFLLILVAIQTVAYFLAAYVAFRARGPLVSTITKNPVGFWEYFNLTTSHLVWKKNYGQGNPLGEFGYTIRFFEILGFVFGSACSALSTMKMPHCSLCNYFERCHTIAFVEAGVTEKELIKNYAASLPKHNEKLAAATKWAKEVHAVAAAGDVQGFINQMRAKLPNFEIAKRLPRRVVVQFRRCPNCRAGTLMVQVWTGKGFNSKIVQPLFKTELPREFISTVEAAFEQQASIPNLI